MTRWTCLAAILTIGLTMGLLGCKMPCCQTAPPDEQKAPVEKQTPAEKPAAAQSPAAATPPAAAPAAEQKLCPVLGNPIDKTVFVDYEGRRIYFCCAMCIDEFKKDPAKYIQKVDEELKGAAKTTAPQSN